jgi:hypothetical protein
MEIEGAEFHRGPHDGLVLTMDEISQFCQLVGKRSGAEDRLFAMMPSPFDWPRVIEDKLSKAGPFDMLYAYELLATDKGPVFLLRDSE